MTRARMAKTRRHSARHKQIQQPHIYSDEKRWRGKTGARFLGTK